MSNRAFDLLDAKCRVLDCREAVAAWGRALVRTDISDAEVKFLSGSLRIAREHLADAEAWLVRGAI
jgi:hypothetical protein